MYCVAAWADCQLVNHAGVAAGETLPAVPDVAVGAEPTEPEEGVSCVLPEAAAPLP